MRIFFLAHSLLTGSYEEFLLYFFTDSRSELSERKKQVELLKGTMNFSSIEKFLRIWKQWKEGEFEKLWKAFWENDITEKYEWLNSKMNALRLRNERGQLYLKMPEDLALYRCLRFDGNLYSWEKYINDIREIYKRNLRKTKKENEEENWGTRTLVFGKKEKKAEGLLNIKEEKKLQSYWEEKLGFHAGSYEHLVNILFSDHDEKKKRREDFFLFNGAQVSNPCLVNSE
mgnify:CR=1 FL=1